MKNQYIIFAIIIVCILNSSMIYSTPINQYINTITPSQNAISVIKSSNITIVFTQDMNPASVNNSNIKVFGYQTGLLPVTIDYNPVNKTANIIPNQDLKAGEKISVTLTSRIRTISDESIASFVFSFTIKNTGGTGNFILSSEIVSQSNYIRSGDVDSDGDIDLLISDKIFKNNGTAVFSYYSSIPLLGYPLMADFDNDGDLDILVSENSMIYFFSNNGIGDFSQTNSFPGGLHSFGDLDGNGFLDITYFSPSSALKINVSKNLSGIFTFDNSYNVNFNLPCGPSSGFDHRILIDDMNNNGKLDLVLINGNAGGGSILGYQFCQIYTLLKNNGDANYISELLFTHDAKNLPYWVINTGDPQLFDNNNDGLIDINSPGLIVRNNGDNLFSVSGNLNAFSTIIPGDFNGDSKLDILAQIFGVSPLLTHLNDGTGNFQEYFIGSDNFYGRAYATGDFDNDGDLDVAGSFTSSKVAILLNGDIPLPVELSSFTSETETNNITLNWTTSSEENNAGYDIEKTMFNVQSSMFNDNWSKAGFVKGNGTTNNTINYTFTDKNLQSGKYKYRLKQTDFNGNFKYYELSNEVTIGVPDKFYLSQNYPNPFNPTSNLGFGISKLGFISLKVYDSQGKEVAVLVNENKAPGYYNIQFDGSNLSSGVYYYRLESKGFVQTKRMMLLK
ncbi:MAG: VCBS repeat-containing protein [Ignavibacteria bacterium]|jgi:hypothetical protein|nr:VCBS repeat-containing protein [Ignavibacteria bacterium]